MCRAVSLSTGENCTQPSGDGDLSPYCYGGTLAADGALTDAEDNSVVTVSVGLPCSGKTFAHLGFRLGAFPARLKQAEGIVKPDSTR